MICLKILVGVCVREGLAASVCVCRIPAASVELLPRGWRAVAFPLSLHVLKAARRGSEHNSHCSMFVVVASAACVYETSLPLLFAHVAILLLSLSRFLGVGASSLSLASFLF